MAKLINVYKGMDLTPEQEREMFVEAKDIVFIS